MKLRQQQAAAEPGVVGSSGVGGGTALGGASTRNSLGGAGPSLGMASDSGTVDDDLSSGAVSSWYPLKRRVGVQVWPELDVGPTFGTGS